MNLINKLFRLALAAALMLCLMLNMAWADEGGFTFALNGAGDGYVVTGYTGSGSSVTVPGWYNRKPVVAIGAGAFQGNAAIKSVSLPNSITSIGEAAFKNCTSLSSLSSYTAAAPAAVNATITLSTDSVYAGTSLSANYVVSGGLTPYQEISIQGYSTNSANGETYTFLSKTLTEAEGNVSGVPLWGDQVYLVLTVVEQDGHATTWKSEVIPMTRTPGDANYSGQVNMEDALLVLQYAVDHEISINAGCARLRAAPGRLSRELHRYYERPKGYTTEQ